MRNPTFFEDADVIFRITFYADETKTTPIDPSSVVFTVRDPGGNEFTPAVSNDTGTGKFSSDYVFDSYGDWQWHWQTENPRVVDQGTISIVPRNVA
jgi:hypothetical protein